MINVLVVEDDALKRTAITDVLLTVDDLAADAIAIAEHVSAAKRLMKSRRYDLVVLDIALPFVNGGSIAQDAGVRLLDEVLSRPELYNTPTHFVGITGYRDVYAATAGRFASSLWTLAIYEPGSSDWAESLRARTRHILNATKASELDRRQRVDCCVVSALYQPELVQVLSLPYGWQLDSRGNDDALYWRGTYRRGPSQIEVVACSAARMGMPAASVATAKLLSWYNPKALIMCGIMAGVQRRTAVGDIIVATLCWDWGNGKWVTKSDGEPVFLPAPHQISISPTVREHLKVLAANGDLLCPAWREWKGKKPKNVPRLRMGPIASGAAVLADSRTIVRLTNEHRELLGVEMEFYGASVAAEEALRPRPSVISLKAVVDFADGRKSDDYQDYGAYMSANALGLVLSQLFETPRL